MGGRDKAGQVPIKEMGGLGNERETGGMKGREKQGRPKCSASVIGFR
jgi:hypothetical protein